MKNILIVSVLALTFALAASAQTNQASSCPTLQVSGGGVPEPNQPTSFTANIDTKGKDLTLEYIWTVSSGKISSGQGTQTITVEQVLDQNLTATVEIKGFPEGCPNTSSESHVWCPRPQPINIGEFLNFDTAIEKKQLEKLKEQLADNPNTQVYVIGRFKRNTPEKKTAQTLKRIGSFLMKELALDAGRITMVTVLGEQDYSEIWLVPPGAESPAVR